MDEQRDPRADGPRADMAGVAVDHTHHRGFTGITFGDAIEALKRGRVVTRNGWNGRGQRLELQRPDMHSKMTRPYVYIVTVDADRIPWLASQTDILAEDWVVV